MRYFPSITENFIWEELNEAFCYNKKLRYYTDKRRKYNRRMNGAIIAGAVTSAILAWSGTAVPWGCGLTSSITALLAITEQLAPIFEQSETELAELDNAATFFAEYQVFMEKLYTEKRYANLSTEIAEARFFEKKYESAEEIIYCKQIL